MTDLAFPPQQADALHDVERWLATPSESQTYELFGYAGTGKTTLAKYLAASVGGRVYFAAFTGKAAHVLRRKGCANATTIHKLIYRPSGESPESPALRKSRDDLDDALGELAKLLDAHAAEIALEKAREDVAARQAEVTRLESREPKRRPQFSVNDDSEMRGADLVVIDECSMVDERMGRDLEAFGARILVLGDPAQLPPVGGGGYFTERRPRTLLTEIHRQASESGILRVATMVRQGGRPQAGKYGDDCEVVRPRDADLERLARDADQVLVGRNKTRHASNAKMRRMLGLGDGTPFPVPGDRLVCLRNNHHLGLLNGSTWKVHAAQSDPGQMLSTMEVSSVDEPDGTARAVTSWLHHFCGREGELARMGWDRRHYDEFDHGFALTVHKSQGSQWDDVYLYDESSSFGQDAARHLYTGVTRAAKSLTLVVP